MFCQALCTLYLLTLYNVVCPLCWWQVQINCFLFLSCSILYCRWDLHWDGPCRLQTVLCVGLQPTFCAWQCICCMRAWNFFFFKVQGSSKVAKQMLSFDVLKNHHLMHNLSPSVCSLYIELLAPEVMFLRLSSFILTCCADKRIIKQKDLSGSGNLVVMTVSWIPYQRHMWRVQRMMVAWLMICGYSLATIMYCT